MVEFSRTTELGLIDGRFRFDELYKLIDLSLVAVLLLLLVPGVFALADGVTAVEFDVVSKDVELAAGVALLLALTESKKTTRSERLGYISKGDEKKRVLGLTVICRIRRIPLRLFSFYILIIYSIRC